MCHKHQQNKLIGKCDANYYTPEYITTIIDKTTNIQKLTQKKNWNRGIEKIGKIYWVCRDTPFVLLI